MTTPPLYLHEELLLLALRDEEGTIEFGVDYPHAMGGAALAQLLIDGRVRLDGTKKARVHSASASPLKDAFLDECSKAVRNAGKLRTAQDWVMRFGGTRNLKHRIAEALCDKGILRLEHDKVLGLFPRKVYPEVDGRPEEEIVERLREAIFTDSKEVDSRTTVLISLAQAAGILPRIFPKAKLRARRDRIERIGKGDLVGKATREAIEATQAAMFVAVYVPIIIS